MPLTSRVAKDFVRLHGESATLRRYEDSGSTDDHGETIWTENDTTVQVVRGFGTSTRVPERLKTSMGESRPMDFEFIMLTEDVPPKDEVQVTGKLPRIITSGGEYRILDFEDMRIGVSRLLAESLRTFEGA